MVIIDDKLVDSHVKYLTALKAYWLGDHFGRRAIAKNAIIIVVGVKQDKVRWSETSTGMPFGNEVMAEQLSLRFAEDNKVPLTPQAVIGNPRLQMRGMGENAKPKLTMSENPGVIEKTILKDYPFLRASMGCKGDDDGKSCLGYDNLVSKIEPSSGAKVTMGAIAVLIALILWGLAVPFDWYGWITNPRSQSELRSQRLRDRSDLFRRY